MILVRDIFQVKFGRMKDVLALLKEVDPLWPAEHRDRQRILTDVTGPYYTLVLEQTFDDLAGFEHDLPEMMNDARWRAWYQRFQSFIESGRREIFRVVPQLVPVS